MEGRGGGGRGERGAPCLPGGGTAAPRVTTGAGSVLVQLLNVQCNNVACFKKVHALKSSFCRLSCGSVSGEVKKRKTKEK